ncbi:BA75_00810T0 [Komagataella pastoris]|uniref:BA75_00810T0 n=1 Tax=Komagataella pastoris TaxID=4922 RepID=A0A1B2J7N9_PICPA|nr:BA75_00810T0 [Komagataella pastoris]
MQDSKQLYLKYLAVVLIAIQFSFDSCVYLSSVVHYIQNSGAENPDVFLSVMQAVSAAVQIFVSLIIGNIAEWVGSIKWVIVSLYFLSFVGNFLYSCGGAISLNAILAGRIICGAASASGALVFSYITAITQDRATVFKLLAIYRTSAGIFMSVAQLFAILFGFCNFEVNGYRITSYNAPTFASSFMIFVILLLLIVVLENPKVKETGKQNYLDALRQFFGAKRQVLISCLILLWSMFLSSFIMCEVIYFMPIFLTLHLNWGTKLQGLAFMVATLLGTAGSYFAPNLIHLRTFFSSAKEITEVESNMIDAEQMEKHIKTDSRDFLYENQALLSLLALLISLVGQAFMIGASEALQHESMPPTNSGIFFVAGLLITMLGYNILASTIPSIFSMYIDSSIKVRLMPSVGAVAGVGKLVAPIILAALYNTRLGLSIGVGFGMMLVTVSLPQLAWLKKKRC